MSQVLRYSALGAGIFYGFYHQRTIYATQRTEQAKQEYAHKQKLIDQAKAEYSKTKAPAPASSASATSGRKSPDGLLPHSHQFDMVAYLSLPRV